MTAPNETTARELLLKMEILTGRAQLMTEQHKLNMLQLQSNLVKLRDKLDAEIAAIAVDTSESVDDVRKRLSASLSEQQ